MSKTKASGPGHYEVLFIIPNKYTEEEAQKVSEEVKDMITKKSGEITHHEFWGKKKLAYPINHDHFGYYSLYEFDLDKLDLKELNENLRLFDKTIRHQIVKLKKRTSEEIAKDRERSETIYKQEKEEAGQKVQDKKEKKEKLEEEIEAAEKKQVKDEGKVDLEDLDKKLDGILEAKDLIE